MPELPEVDVVRAGLAPAITGSRVVGVEIFDERSLKRHNNLIGNFEKLITHAVLMAPVRRGKFLWVPIASAQEALPEKPLALLAHLGMSGQMLIREPGQENNRHVRVRILLQHPTIGDLQLDFADQRLFGSLAVDSLVPTHDGEPGGLGSDDALVPQQAAHISRDLLDPAFPQERFRAQLSRRRLEIKKALLNQELVSGIGNIYADESLWAARIHPETPSNSLSPRKVTELLGEARSVLQRALAEGGTSFDEQYVNVNGQAGYFEHSLNVYGRQRQGCPRCGTPIIRTRFMNRGSHFCPRCQRPPRKP